MSFGRSDGRGRDQPAAEEPDRHFEFRDRRRIDPATGELRDLPQPGSAAANPGDPANAAQPIKATADAAELEAARQEAAERTADLQRITAEYANYRKRTERDKQQATAAGKAMVVAELLAVLDDLERADAHGDLTGGFKTVADKLTATLNRMGLAHYGAVNDEFDPNLHEAVQFATSPEVSHPTVTAVLRRGYHFDDRVLRPAVVAVTGPEHEPVEPAASGAAAGGGDGASGGGPAGDGASGGGSAGGGTAGGAQPAGAAGAATDAEAGDAAGAASSGGVGGGGDDAAGSSGQG